MVAGQGSTTVYRVSPQHLSGKFVSVTPPIYLLLVLWFLHLPLEFYHHTSHKYNESPPPFAYKQQALAAARDFNRNTLMGHWGWDATFYPSTFCVVETSGRFIVWQPIGEPFFWVGRDIPPSLPTRPTRLAHTDYPACPSCSRRSRVAPPPSGRFYTRRVAPPPLLSLWRQNAAGPRRTMAGSSCSLAGLPLSQPSQFTASARNLARKAGIVLSVCMAR